MTETVLIYDNDQTIAKEWTDALNNLDEFSQRFRAEVMDRSSIGILEGRYDDFQAGKQWEYSDVDLDDACMLVIDFRLGAITTGEMIAYLVRCFSRCQILVGVNQFGENPFDLTLTGHTESYCDLNIGSKQLTNPGLWGHKREGFRPWCWPVLPDLLDKSKKRLEQIAENLDEMIVEILGISDEVDYLPRSISRFLGASPATVTFREFVVKSGNGLQAKDRKLYNSKKMYEEFIVGIASSQLSKWMEKHMLPGQDILVDAPHLVSRYPSLLLGDPSDVNDWDKTAGFGKIDSLSIDHRKIEGFRFKNDVWLSKPVWFWRGVSTHSEIGEVSKPWNRRQIDIVFCEDTSRFCRKNDARRFFADVDSPYVRRYVSFEDFKDVDYEPYVSLVLLDDSLDSESNR